MNVSNVTSRAATEAALPPERELGRDAFLRLLVTQLEHQDPSDPVSNENFIAQLAQFSSLEQLEQINGSLETLIEFQKTFAANALPDAP